ncbi:hypothetical protein ACFL4W_03955 [Planctomycetota bacterium]
MVHINKAAREINLKIVYCSVSGEAGLESLKLVRTKLPRENAGEIISINTATGQTLFFDFLPITLGNVHGYDLNLKLYAAPEAGYYDASRRLVFNGADGVIFIADTRVEKKEKNLQFLDEVKESIAGEGRLIPVIFQWNFWSTELDGIPLFSVDSLNALLNPERQPSFAVIQGEEVLNALKETVKMVFSAM